MAAPVHDPTERLLRATGRRLAVFTLLLVAALVAVVGITTALVATDLMRENIDRTLRAAATDRLLLHELSEDDEEYGLAPVGSADTFMLLVDEQGRLLRNPSDVGLDGLPDVAAVDAARQGEDIRDGRYGGVDVRLLTTPVIDLSEYGISGDRLAYLQVGFVLTLQNAQQRELLGAVLVIGLLGLAGAALVTLLVTRRALVPIRSAFATERRFVAAASHELRTPVAVIQSSAEVLEREELVDDAGRPLVDDVIGEADRLGRLVGDLMSLASAEAGAIELDRQPLELRSWFADVSRRAEALAETEEVPLDIRRPPGTEPIVIIGDPDRLEQLLHILVDNALRHAPIDTPVIVELEAVGDRARIAISDDGPGIPAEDRQRVFEPFSRLGSDRDTTGAGLGLAIARQLAILHGATLQVADGPAGKGTTLELIIELAPPGSVPAALPAEPTAG